MNDVGFNGFDLLFFLSTMALCGVGVGLASRAMSVTRISRTTGQRHKLQNSEAVTAETRT